MKKLDREDVKVKYSTLFCKYCYWYRKASDRDLKKLIRLCPRRKKKWIGADDNACKRFRVSKYFWCELYNYWLTLAECDSRRESLLTNLKCNNCKRQRFQVDRVIRYAETTAKLPKLKKLERKPKKKRLLRKAVPKKTLKKLEKSKKQKRVLKRRA